MNETDTPRRLRNDEIVSLFYIASTIGGATPAPWQLTMHAAAERLRHLDGSTPGNISSQFTDGEYQKLLCKYHKQQITIGSYQDSLRELGGYQRVRRLLAWNGWTYRYIVEVDPRNLGAWILSLRRELRRHL